ncbi:hypothetical protein WJ977_19910 [Achromobacter xylosoxidans]
MAWTALTHLLLPQAAPAGDARVADEPALSRREFAAQCLAVAGALQARGAGAPRSGSKMPSRSPSPCSPAGGPASPPCCRPTYGRTPAPRSMPTSG